MFNIEPKAIAGLVAIVIIASLIGIGLKSYSSTDLFILDNPDKEYMEEFYTYKPTPSVCQDLFILGNYESNIGYLDGVECGNKYCLAKISLTKSELAGQIVGMVAKLYNLGSTLRGVYIDKQSMYFPFYKKMPVVYWEFDDRYDGIVLNKDMMDNTYQTCTELYPKIKKRIDFILGEDEGETE